MVEIYTAGGKMIGKISGSKLPGGEHQVTWDGYDEGGNMCPAGLYIYRVTAGKAHSTGTIIKM
jgi:flagellar hook assembly protein FlgD